MPQSGAVRNLPLSLTLTLTLTRTLTLAWNLFLARIPHQELFDTYFTEMCTCIDADYISLTLPRPS